MAEEKQAVGPEDIEKCLTAMEFPAKKEDMINHARTFCASENVIAELRKLPDRTYKSRQDVITEYEGMWGEKAA